MEIGFLLQKYAKLGFGQKRIKEIVLETLLDSFSITLESSDVEVKDTEVKIRVSGVRKTQLFLLKAQIEKTLQEKFQKEGLVVSKIF